ncbi:MAG: cyclic pyranopterin monophosphate synthase MoaC [Chloroflexi bacterium]|nr:cyclic pyranopterin monophosphate synthase MoaC [Chloroflexota bacterium]|tara:strand:+ start:844 stop:1332 length:489 start_codon:yes stop_codon:yes gene_type:complete
MKEKNKKTFSHIDDLGNARMVNIEDKKITQRKAIAIGMVKAQKDTISLIKKGGFKKGDVLGVARIAGIMAAKNTSQLIPMCHNIPLTHVEIEFELEDSGIVSIKASARTTGKTGVEMEALTAASIACLTIYDMCKSADKSMSIEGIRLIHKSGGKTGELDFG